MPSFKAREGLPYTKNEMLDVTASFANKMLWFLSRPEPYQPHNWQTLFHTMRNPESGQLCRFRHLVAGRRGGKTLSAAWELLYYLMNPEQFHLDAHGTTSKNKLVCWVLTRDYPAGLPALMTFRDVLQQAGLQFGKEYKENKGNRWFEFENGSYLFFKTADEPDALRGAGLDILWMDEAAFIPNENAWNVVRPALSDKLGHVVSTTTPSGKNWFYDEFWSPDALTDPNIGRVEYWSIDNPYFPKEEWDYMRRRYHPLLFKQEYCAAFDSMAGKELSGDWLNYYTWPEVPKSEGKAQLDYYIGVDPAISLSDKADRFALAVIGMAKDHSQAYLVDMYAGRIPFTEQITKIQEFHQLYHPIMIGIESNAYQAALATQASRLDGLPPIVAIMSKGKKFERILSMSPLFRIGRVKIRTDHRDFIDEWLDYDSELKNPKDDCLDAVEICLRTMGALLPDQGNNSVDFSDSDYKPQLSLQDLAYKSSRRKKGQAVDDTLGLFW